MEGTREVIWLRRAGGLSWTRECPQPFVLHAHHLRNVSTLASHFIF